jgi:glucoamylase
VASLSIPWGEAQNDQGGGYHFVWPRDMCQSATALLATGEVDLPLRALHFLAATQRTDGSWNQNFYITGKYHWTGIQLDEFSFPVILAYRLKQHGALQLYDPRPMVMAAANALVSYGPLCSEERWEENAGFSPSTLAANIAALVCAANFSAENAADAVTTQFLLDYADFLESKLEDWLVTTNGPLPNGPRYYIRILPPGQPEDPNTANKTFYIKNRGYGLPPYAPNEIVDGGFLELVRYGIRSAKDPNIQATVRVVDAVIKKDGLPAGPCWYRYNHDGYGQNADGSPFLSTGQGRPWPLLAGERAHYELAAGNNVSAYVRSLETMAAPVSLLPEQVWDAAPQGYGDFYFVPGGPTGSSRPLAWAHAEYIKLIRSVSDGAVFDRIDVVANRYLDEEGSPADKPKSPSNLEVWNWNRPVSAIPRGKTLRIITIDPARVHWSDNVAADGTWIAVHDTNSTGTSLRQVNYTDLPTNAAPGSRLMFSFYWLRTNNWENQTYTVQIL